MQEKLIQLFNNLNCVETRGESTIIMAGALTLLNQMIAKINEAEDTESKEQKSKEQR